MTVLGPVVIIAVALSGMARLGDRSDQVEERAARQALALELKFAVTDLNGWQRGYGYEHGDSPPRFEQPRPEVLRVLARTARRLTDARESAWLGRLRTGLRGFLAVDEVPSWP